MPKLCGMALEYQEGENIERKTGLKRKHIDLVQSKNKKIRELKEE